VTETGAPADYRLGFESLEDEVALDSLPLEGRLPDWLWGTLHRVGPAKFEVGGRPLNHFYDGFSMLHRFSFDAGKVAYRNRFLESRAYRAAEDTGRLAYLEFATNPDRSLRDRVATAFMPRMTDNAGVNLIRLDAGPVALATGPRPIRLDPLSLAARGVLPRAPAELSTPYPRHDRPSGETLFFGLRLGPRPSYLLYARRGARAVREIARLPAAHPTYLSSFAISERFAVLVECPFSFSPMELIFAGRPYFESFRWHRDRPAWFDLVDRRSGHLHSRLEAEPFFSFHSVNAFERGADLLVDLIAYPDAAVLSCLYLERLRAGAKAPLPELRRYRLPLLGGETSYESIAPGFEMPEIDHAAHDGRSYRYLYGSRHGTDTFISALQKADLETGETTQWSEAGLCPDSVCFVPRPGARDEDDGVLLTALLEPTAGVSSLLVLDARDLQELCRARLPHHLPFTLGGALFSSDQMTGSRAA
jgi:carotenoid cleavage dioxygenase-like enzyme